MVLDFFNPDLSVGHGNGMISTGGDTTLSTFTVFDGGAQDLPSGPSLILDPPGPAGFMAFRMAPIYHFI